MPTHSHSASTNTAGTHAHTFTGASIRRPGGTASAKYDFLYPTGTNTTNTAGEHSHIISINNTGASEFHNNMQPYISVYMWKRID